MNLRRWIHAVATEDPVYHPGFSAVSAIVLAAGAILVATTGFPWDLFAIPLAFFALVMFSYFAIAIFE